MHDDRRRAALMRLRLHRKWRVRAETPDEVLGDRGDVLVPFGLARDQFSGEMKRARFDKQPLYFPATGGLFAEIVRTLGAAFQEAAELFQLSPAPPFSCGIHHGAFQAVSVEFYVSTVRMRTVLT